MSRNRAIHNGLAGSPGSRLCSSICVDLNLGRLGGGLGFELLPESLVVGDDSFDDETVQLFRLVHRVHHDA